MLNRRPASHPPQTELHLQNRTGQHLPGETGCCSSKAVKAEEPHVNIHNSLWNPFLFLLGRTAFTAFESVGHCCPEKRGLEKLM